MQNLTDNITWETFVSYLETSDALLGGPTGPLNVAAQQLANRTAWLKDAIKGYPQVSYFLAGQAFLRDEVGYKLNVINANNATLVFTLPDSSDVDNPLSYGFSCVFKATNVNKSQVTLQAAGTDKILDGSGFDPVGLRTKIYLGDGEMIKLTWTSQGWLITGYNGNFDDIGGVLQRYKLMPNTVIAQGQLLNRADYPRLWEYAQTLGGSLISDGSWLGSPANHGFFSVGNGSTTFRIPDLRGQFMRNLDLGAGIDLSRTSGNAGAYEADDLKAHTHGLPVQLSAYGTHSGAPDSERAFIRGVGYPSESTGGLETRPKNIGLLPLIKV